jgi:hypothetical protein
VGDLVVVTNQGNSAFTITYDNKNYVLTPQKDAYVPFAAVCLWFGDPRSTGQIQVLGGEENPQVVPSRDEEVRRLSVKYGHQVGGVDEYLKGEVPNSPVPKVIVRTLDSKDPIPTVLDDPSGTTTTPAVQSIAAASTQDQIIKRQQQQIDLLTSILQRQGMMNEYDTTEGEIPQDTSTTTPASDPFANL